jgi:hypothetical protein
MELKRRGRADWPILSSYGEFPLKEKRHHLRGHFFTQDMREAGIGLATQPGIN